MPIEQYAVASDTGLRRRRNEDNYVVAPPLFAVADGVGGAQAGEVASQLAASTLEAGTSEELGALERVEALIQEANRRIFDRASTDPSASGMGTTMTVALVEDMNVVIGHVGDSRAYLVRGDSMEQLTEDHSLVNELVKSGKLSEAEAQIHPQRNVIMRVVGTDPDVDVDVFTIEAEDGDVFLLCSDGLSDMVEDIDILDLVDRNRGDLEKAVRALVQFANKEGGEDNITAVAFRIAAGSAEPALEDTVTMAALSDAEDPREPDERTPESVEVPPAAETPAVSRRRVWIALSVLVLVVIAAALLIWGLSR
ncbi:MAG TPA: Stp1/IreP family PP2C-type Ser/Thr phosphatase [Gaiellaceae bacterium]